ncbi:MAG: hypothetical protein Q9177_001983, partial [Variospora cf. flavescens]
MLTERLKDASSEDENSDFEAEKFFDSIDWPMPPAGGSSLAANQQQPPQGGLSPPWKPPHITSDKAGLIQLADYVKETYIRAPAPRVMKFRIQFADFEQEEAVNYLWNNCNYRILEIVKKTAGMWTQQDEDMKEYIWRSWLDGEGNFSLPDYEVEQWFLAFCFPLDSLH